MRYDKTVELIEKHQTNKVSSYPANITQMGLDQTINIFGDAKQRPYVVRLPIPVDFVLNLLTCHSLKDVSNFTVSEGILYIS